MTTDQGNQGDEEYQGDEGDKSDQCYEGDQGDHILHFLYILHILHISEERKKRLDIIGAIFRLMRNSCMSRCAGIYPIINNFRYHPIHCSFVFRSPRSSPSWFQRDAVRAGAD